MTKVFEKVLDNRMTQAHKLSLSQYRQNVAKLSKSYLEVQKRKYHDDQIYCVKPISLLFIIC